MRVAGKKRWAGEACKIVSKQRRDLEDVKDSERSRGSEWVDGKAEVGGGGGENVVFHSSPLAFM